VNLAGPLCSRSGITGGLIRGLGCSCSCIMLMSLGRVSGLAGSSPGLVSSVIVAAPPVAAAAPPVLKL
jgi:hypothetical protein